MVTVRTNLGDLQEAARYLRVEEIGAITTNNVQEALELLSGIAGGGWAQRSIESSGDLPILPTDVVLNIATSAPLSVVIPAASTRAGLALLLQDPTGTWAANNPTFTATGGDTFDGQSSLTGTINYGWIWLRPYSDGINAGYKVQGIYQ